MTGVEVLKIKRNFLYFIFVSFRLRKKLDCFKKEKWWKPNPEINAESIYYKHNIWLKGDEK